MGIDFSFHYRHEPFGGGHLLADVDHLALGPYQRD